ncbi:guanine nucleotide exchange factor, putative [Entamoeba invadens IP1]|uniref:Guanine nucleotide exchange factor, putative n=1 Tax=Entamoeba invadens IP1 TaxID=370355 RepID=A0A0A1TUL3_ENTIV|nr:guanine nucleotide exchange factor, putative [Entamoeba invadens IP1]ELP83750.1 guanine nucleotide exchange factor, putative [Entamoeba invadens IP1]|eukprot:XP_004183096.1 guanine nucleotide exchange factor, putative [Entamoeba invadens IP1]
MSEKKSVLLIRPKCPLVDTRTVNKNEEIIKSFPTPLKDIVSSPTNIVFLTENNELYITGRVFDQTQHGVSLFPYSVCARSRDSDVVSVPTRIEGINFVIDKVSMGSFFCMLLSKGRLYTWGSFSFGQLGIPDARIFNKPELVPQLSGIQDVSCGSCHTLALNVWGEIFSWGQDDYGQLGRSRSQKNDIPTDIEFFRNHVVTKIFTGAFCSACITDEGMAFIWGKHLKMKEIKRTPTQLSFKKTLKLMSSFFVISIELAYNDIFLILHDGTMHRFIDFDDFEEVDLLSRIGVTRAVGGTHFTLVETDTSDIYQLNPKEGKTATTNVIYKASEFDSESHVGAMCTNAGSVFVLLDYNKQYGKVKTIVMFLRKFMRQIECIVSYYMDPMVSYAKQLENGSYRLTKSSNAKKRASQTPRDLTKSSAITSDDEAYVFSTEDVMKMFYGIKPLTYLLPQLLCVATNILNLWRANSTIYQIVEKFLELNISRQFVDISVKAGECFALLKMMEKKSPELQECAKRQQELIDQFDAETIFDGKTDLPSLMLLAVKFVPQFYQLVDDYYKTLDESQEDYLKLHQILPKFEKLLSRVNDSFHLDNIFDIVNCFPDESGNVSITSGGVTELITRLYNMNLNDPSYTDMFLMTHKKFTDSETVVLQLVDAYTAGVVGEDSKACILSVLSHWFRSYPGDFANKADLVGIIRILVTKSEQTDLTQTLQASLNSLGMSLAKRKNSRVFLPLNTSTSLKYTHFLPANVMPLAKVLNYFNTLIFSRVSYEELILINWGSPKNKENTPNLQNMTERFNWIGDTVVRCFNECPKSERVKFIEGIILMMKTFQGMKDIHFLVAITYCLKTIDIDSIKTKKLSSEDNAYLLEMEQLCTFQKNYKFLRQYMQQLETPYIPFIGVVSKDLMLVDEGNPDFVGENLINVYKWRKIYELIEQVIGAKYPQPKLECPNEELQILVQTIYSFK